MPEKCLLHKVIDEVCDTLVYKCQSHDIHFATDAALHKLVENCKTYEQPLARNLHDDETLG